MHEDKKQFVFSCNGFTVPLEVLPDGMRAAPDYLRAIHALIASPENRAAMTVYDKYKRKLKLEFEHLGQLRTQLLAFSIQRTALGKAVHFDLLTQHASKLVNDPAFVGRS